MNILNAKSKAYYVIKSVAVKEKSVKQKITYLGFIVGKKIYKERSGFFNSCQIVVIDGKRIVVSKEISKEVYVDAL